MDLSAEIAAAAVKNLKTQELLILFLLAKYLNRFRIFPLDALSALVGASEKNLKRTLTSLHKKNLVECLTAPYNGVVLKMSGLDALSLHSLSSFNIISSFGRKVGVGKESDIYEALTPNNEKVCLKFYRIGRTSFRDVVRKRNYVPPGQHVSWFLKSIVAAGREFLVLKRLYSHQVPVPKPIARNRHVVVMEHLNGEIVARARYVKNPDLVLRKILDAVKTAYMTGYVNADLSAYNVFVTSDGRVLIIDWPQAVRVSEKFASEKLMLDLQRICHYFEKRFGVKIDIKKEYQRIAG